MSAMGESKYLLSAQSGQNRHPHHSPQDSTTPYSAVSSFNLPPYCDSSLITPVSVTQSPPMTTKTTPTLKSENAFKFSPSEMSPTFQFMASDDEYKPRYHHNPFMKYKNPSGTLHASSTDSAFPVSPFFCPEPFWGAHGVSATPVSVRSESSPSGNPSPAQLHSAGALSSSSSSYSRQQASPQSTAGYRSQNPAPILIVPSPLTLRPATLSSRQSSLQSLSSAPSSTALAQNPFPEPLGSLPPRGKKRKSPSTDYQDRAMVLDDTDRPDEILLLELTHQQHTPWKEVVDIFKARFGLDCTPSRLQMRKKRLIDRLRRWTEEDIRALTLAVEELGTNHWGEVSEAMLMYGCRYKYAKDSCQKKWLEMNPEEGTWFTEYDESEDIKYLESEGWGSDEEGLSDSYTSRRHTLQEGFSRRLMSSTSMATMEEVKGRAASDASLQLPRRQQHQQFMFEQQHQRSGWDA